MPKKKDPAHEPTRSERVYARAATPGANFTFQMFSALLVPLLVGLFVWIWNIDRQVLIILQHQDNAAKFWILHGWERDEINKLRIEQGMGLATWPNLPGRGHDGH